MEWIELGKLAEITSGQGAPKNSTIYSKEGTPFIRAGNLKELSASGNLNVCDKIKGEIGKSLGLKIYKKGTVVFAKSGMSCLKSYIYMLEEDSFVVNHLACLNIDRNHLIPKYLKYVLEYRKPKELINDTSYPSIRINDIRKFKIPVPAMEIQEKIVKILDQAQALIDKRKEQIEALDQLIESIFYTMFGDPVRNEKGWEIEQLGDLVMINPKKSEVSDMKKSDMYVSFVPMKDVGEDGVLDLQERRKLNDVYAGYTYFKENDVLFAKITPCMENGKSCIAKGLINEIGFGSTEFHVIRESTVLTKEYIFNLVRSKKFKEEAENKMTGSAGQKRVPREFLESYSISVPPLYLQNEFAQKVEAIEKQKEILRESLELTEGNYKSIMNKAFKGQLFN